MVNSGEMLQILKEDNELISRGRERGREVHFLATKKTTRVRVAIDTM